MLLQICSIMIDYFLLCARAFHHYRGVDNQRPAPKKHPELDQLLKEKYRGLDDFHRAKEKVPSTKEDSH